MKVFLRKYCFAVCFMIGTVIWLMQEEYSWAIVWFCIAGSDLFIRYKYGPTLEQMKDELP